MLKYLLSLLVCISTLFASENVGLERFELTLNNDSDDDTVIPDFYIPVYFTDNFYSGIGARNRATFSNYSVENSSLKQKTSISTTYENLWLDIINYKIIQDNQAISFGLSTSYEKIKVIQFGYAEIPQTANSLATTDSVTDMQYINVGLYSDYSITNLMDMVSVRTGIYLYPLTYSRVTEAKTFYPSIKEEGKITSSSIQDIRYRVFVSAQLDINTYISLLSDVSYEYIPSDTKALGIGIDNSSLIFTESNLVYNSATTIARLKVLFPTLSVYGVSPSVGIGYKDIYNDIVYTNGEAEQSSVYSTFYTVGFDKAF